MAVQQLPRLVVMVPQLVIDKLIIHIINLDIELIIHILDIKLIKLRVIYADSEGGQGL